MNKFAIALTAFALATPALANAECVRPTAPSLADGETAELSDLATSQEEVKAYVGAANEYLSCLEKEEMAATEAGTETEETKASRLANYNGTVDEMNAVAAAWKIEIQEYNAREAGK